MGPGKGLFVVFTCNNDQYVYRLNACRTKLSWLVCMDNAFIHMLTILHWWPIPLVWSLVPDNNMVGALDLETPSPLYIMTKEMKLKIAKSSNTYPIVYLRLYGYMSGSVLHGLKTARQLPTCSST